MRWASRSTTRSRRIARTTSARASPRSMRWAPALSRSLIAPAPAHAQPAASQASAAAGSQGGGNGLQMSKRAFNKIMQGVGEARAYLEGTADKRRYRVHVPERVDANGWYAAAHNSMDGPKPDDIAPPSQGECMA